MNVSAECSYCPWHISGETAFAFGNAYKSHFEHNHPHRIRKRSLRKNTQLFCPIEGCDFGIVVKKVEGCSFDAAFTLFYGHLAAHDMSAQTVAELKCYLDDCTFQTNVNFSFDHAAALDFAVAAHLELAHTSHSKYTIRTFYFSCSEHPHPQYFRYIDSFETRSTRNSETELRRHNRMFHNSEPVQQVELEMLQDGTLRPFSGDNSVLGGADYDHNTVVPMDRMALAQAVQQALAEASATANTEATLRGLTLSAADDDDFDPRTEWSANERRADATHERGAIQTPAPSKTTQNGVLPALRILVDALGALVVAMEKEEEQ